MINSKRIIILVAALFFSCNKQLDSADQTNSAVTEAEIQTVQQETLTLTETELERVFNELDETNVTVGSMILGLPIVEVFNRNSPLVNPLPDPISGTEKKFKFNILGIRAAVKYAGNIMEYGGCIKAWIDGDGMINVEEIPC